MKLLFALIAISTLSAACSPSFIKKGGESSAAHTTPYEGNSYLLVQSFYKEGKNLSQKCDIDLKAKKLEITQQLEKRRGEINKEIESIAQDKNNSDIPRKKFGNVWLRDNLDAPVASSRWEVQHLVNWYDIIKLYEEIKNTPVNKKWIWLNDDVRYLLSDEYDRLMWDANMSLKHDDEYNLMRLINTITACKDNADCKKVELDEELQSWIRTKRYYPQDLKSVNTSANFKRDLERYLKYVSEDHEITFQAGRRGHVYDRDTNTLTVRMDLSVFAEDKNKIIDILSDAWSRYGFKINILTVEDPLQSFYKVVVDPTNVRGTTYYNSQKVVIFPGAKLKLLVHEFGHVLGLKDEYYKLWFEEECGYGAESNSGNIMSEHTGGQVLKHHIQTLKSIY